MTKAETTRSSDSNNGKAKVALDGNEIIIRVWKKELETALELGDCALAFVARNELVRVGVVPSVSLEALEDNSNA